MRHLLPLLLLFGILLGNSCKKREYLNLSCLKEKLGEHDMVRYDGQEVSGCTDYLHLYVFEGKQWYILSNPCVFRISYPTDCEGNKLCTDTNEDLCKSFNNLRVYKGIVGVSRAAVEVK